MFEISPKWIQRLLQEKDEVPYWVLSRNLNHRQGIILRIK